MKVNAEIVKDELRKLPIGYYIGREVKVVPEDDIQTSYYDMLSDVIHIDTKSIVDTVSRLTDEATIEDIEGDVRCMLYHELSHAMLTPRDLKPNFHLNVVEDVRIETALKGYYLNTDFEEFNKRYVANTPNDCCENGFIRFCKLGEGGTPELREKLNNLIRRYRDLDSRSDPDWYKMKVDNLYDEYKDWWNDNYEDNQDNDVNNALDEFFKSFEGNGNGNGSSGTDSSDGSSTDDKSPAISPIDQDGQSDVSASDANAVQVKASDEGDETDNESDKFNHDQSHGKEIFAKLKSVTDEYRNEYLMTEFDRILRNFKKITSARSSAVNTYSGVFNPRSAGRDDYRYFVQQNRNGNARGFSRLHLNLFLDESGSFNSSEHIAREVIYTLSWLEKQIPNFDFTLIRCGDGETIADKNDMRYSAYTGTAIGADVFNTFKKVQRRDADNYNILLYDGRAYSSWVSKGHDGYIGNFAAYNTSNTLIITDPGNENAVNTYCPSARKVISRNYTEELINNLVKMVEVLLK